jgi:hypothetical protein
VQFGEIARYKCRSKEGGIGDSGDVWGVGLWLGVESRTGQHVMFDPVQGGIRHARTLMRLPDGQKFDNDRAAAVSMTPFSTHAAERPKRVFAEKLVDPAETNPDAVAKVRGIYIKKEDLEAFGFTPGYKRCRSALTYGNAQGSMPHSIACRLRITEELKKTPAGATRVARMAERTDRFLTEAVEKGDQAAAQGGIGFDMPKNEPPSPAFIPFGRAAAPAVVPVVDGPVAPVAPRPRPPDNDEELAHDEPPEVDTHAPLQGAGDETPVEATMDLDIVVAAHRSPVVA